jgi:haloacid dehalogenase-like hydrolase
MISENGKRMRTTALVDVDNTLIDNDAAKVEIGRRLVDLLEREGAERFWATYEAIRAERGVVDIPHAVARALGDQAALADRIALADLFMLFPFADYIYPGALATLAFLRSLGPVAILSDGDPVFQPTKINRAGLASAVDGRVLIFFHKEEHLAEIAAAFPADRYLLIDDKPDVIARVTSRAPVLGAPLETVFVRQGKYAATVPPGAWPGATYTVGTIAEVRSVLSPWAGLA